MDAIEGLVVTSLFNYTSGKSNRQEPATLNETGLMRDKRDCIYGPSELEFALRYILPR